MIVTYLGKQFFKLTHGDLTVAVNPISANAPCGVRSARFGANVALSSLSHPDYNGVDHVSHGDKNPFVISGPGEYEIGGMYIKGIFNESTISGKAYANTMYEINWEGVKLCFLGALGRPLVARELEEIGTPDILFVPIGGKDVLSPKDAYKLSVALEATVTVPMDYGSDMEKDALKIFLKEAGYEGMKPKEKLPVKKKDLEDEEDVCVLSII